jgi:uroporphyrinogen decarboxylase
MSARELVRQLLDPAGNPERVGSYEHFWAETPEVWLAQGYPALPPESEAAPPEEAYMKVPHVFPSQLGLGIVAKPASPYHVFDYDMHPCGGGFDTEPLRAHEEILEESAEWIVKRNGAGATFKYWKHKSGTPEHLDFRMTGRDVWERDYRPHLLQLDRQRLRGGAIKGSTLHEDRAARAYALASGKWIIYGHLFIWEILRESLGDIRMYECLLLDPAWIADFNAVYTDFFKLHFTALFEELGRPDCIWLYEDLGYKNGLFASPRLLRKLILPYYAELVGFFHAQGLPVLLHSCGNISDALPLIVDAGFDALQPMERKAGCDPFKFAEGYRDRLAFIGGLDVRILESNDRATIRQGVSELVDGMKAHGARYFFASDHSITPLVSYDSYRYALDVYREHMRY